MDASTDVKLTKYLLYLYGEFSVLEASGASKQGYLLDQNGLPVINPKISGAAEIRNFLEGMKDTLPNAVIEQWLHKPENQKYFLKKPEPKLVVQKLLDSDYNFTTEEATYLISNIKYLYDNGHHSLIEALHKFVPEKPFWKNQKYQNFSGYNEFHNAVMDNAPEAIQPFIQGTLPLPGSALNRDEFLVLQDAAVKRNNAVLLAVLEAFKDKHYFKSMLKKVLVASVASGNSEMVKTLLSHAEVLSSESYSNYARSLVNTLHVKAFAEEHWMDNVLEVISDYVVDTETNHSQQELKEFFLHSKNLEIQRRKSVKGKNLEFSAETHNEVALLTDNLHPSFSREVFDAIYPVLKLAYDLEGRKPNYGIDAAYKMAVIYETPETALEGIVSIMQGFAARGVGSLLVFSIPEDNEWTPEAWRESLQQYGKKAAAVIEEAAFIEKIVKSKPDEYNLEEEIDKCCKAGSATKFYAAEAEKRLRDIPPGFDRAIWVKLIRENPKMAIAALEEQIFDGLDDLNQIRSNLDLFEKEPAEIESEDIKALYFISTLKKFPELESNNELKDILNSIISANIDSGDFKKLKSPITMGLESEFHGVKKQHLEVLTSLVLLLQKGWKQTLDSTVEPPDGSLGLEMVSGILGKKDVRLIKPVAQAIKALGGEVSGVCALHVHAGIMNSFADHRTRLDIVKQVLVNYAKLEEKLCFMDSNLTYKYSDVFNDQGMTVDEAIETIKLAENFKQLEEITQPEGRRRASVNLKPLATYGTIEFRQHPGSVEPSEVAAWAKFIDSLVHKSLQMAINEEGVHKPTSLEQIELEQLVDDYLRERKSQDISSKTSILESMGTLSKQERKKIKHQENL
jgi:hypothetical protein